jgi:hypothetical protein
VNQAGHSSYSSSEQSVNKHYSASLGAYVVFAIRTARTCRKASKGVQHEAAAVCFAQQASLSFNLYIVIMALARLQHASHQIRAAATQGM